jgi:hypothetical protein
MDAGAAVKITNAEFMGGRRRAGHDDLEV